MILDDPELTVFSIMLFDEFHERSLDADPWLGLRASMRERLRAISASSSCPRRSMARGRGAPRRRADPRRVKTGGPVETRNVEPSRRIEDTVTSAVPEAIRLEPADPRVFCPGTRDHRVADDCGQRDRSPGRHGAAFGAMPQEAQDLATFPTRDGRRKSCSRPRSRRPITIEGVRVVVDGGCARAAL